MDDVFISYSRKDKDFVQSLYHALHARDRSIWVDWSNIPPTADWWNEIKAGIEAADTFVFVLSPDAIASSVCTDEINHAVLHHKRLVPVVRRDVDATQVHDALRKFNWLFFRENDNFDAALQLLLKAIDTDLEHVRQHRLRTATWQDTELQEQARLALQQTVYGVKERNRLEMLYTAYVRCVCLSPDGNLIVSAVDEHVDQEWQSKVVLWSLSGKRLKTFKGHKNTVLSVCFSSDGKTIASASMDGTIKLWNAETLNFDQLIERGCNWVRDYLKTNPNVEESDRQLCDMALRT